VGTYLRPAPYSRTVPSHGQLRGRTETYPTADGCRVATGARAGGVVKKPETFDEALDAYLFHSGSDALQRLASREYVAAWEEFEDATYPNGRTWSPTQEREIYLGLLIAFAVKERVTV
jgi:hypothetical protein